MRHTLRPAGHVLVAPRTVIARFRDLSPSEVADLWQLAQAVAKCIEAHHAADSLSLVIQARAYIPLASMLRGSSGPILLGPPTR